MGLVIFVWDARLKGFLRLDSLICLVEDGGL